MPNNVFIFNWTKEVAVAFESVNGKAPRIVNTPEAIIVTGWGVIPRGYETLALDLIYEEVRTNPKMLLENRDTAPFDVAVFARNLGIEV